MKIENLYEKAYLKKLTEDIDLGADGGSGLSEPEMSEMPPPQDGTSAPVDGGAPADVGSEDGGRAFSDLKSYMDTLPQDGQVSHQQIIDLGKKYAGYFREVKDTIKELQDKQLANDFEDCLNVKFLPLSKALSNMIDELDAGVTDKVHEKNVKAAKENGASLEM